MIEAEPRPPVRAIVASFLFTDLVGFSKGSATEQYVAKSALSASLRSNLAALRESDYWIKDTGDGALIAFVSNPEHALYMALAIAQDYAQAAEGAPFNCLRTGLHLGTVKEMVDLEARRNYIGDGINATKRIMDFAAPGQIAASRNFFEAVANLDTEYAALFQHVGASDDKHGRAHELYAIAPSAEVLKKLRLDLVAAAPRPAESGRKSAAAVGVKQDTRPALFTDSGTPSDTAAEAARMRFNPIVLIALIALTAAIFWLMRGLWQAAPSVAPLTSQSVAVPVAAKVPDASPTTGGESAAPSPAASSATTPKLDEILPGGTTHAAQGTATNGVTPQVVAPAPAPNITVDRTRKISTSPQAPPVRAPVALDRGGIRCSHIVEKAALGEPLSEEEKKELANSCR